MSLAADVGLCHATHIAGPWEENTLRDYADQRLRRRIYLSSVFFCLCVFQELLESAYTLYNEMVFVTLDIDEFAHWASRFVPRDYHAKHAFGKTPLSFSEFESLWLDLA